MLNVAAKQWPQTIFLEFTFTGLGFLHRAQHFLRNILVITNFQMQSTSLGRNIAIIGLGYVGLPLAVEFGKK